MKYRKKPVVIGTVLRWAARAHEKCDLVASRVTCKRKGHLWDSERPRGAIHKRDICWRCDAVREENLVEQLKATQKKEDDDARNRNGD